MTQRNVTLKNGSRICIVGGGPAGCFAAMHAQKLGAERGLEFEIIVFDIAETPKGQIYCKGCAGILSSRLQRGLQELNIELDRSVIQEEIVSYVVHVPGAAFIVNKPLSEQSVLSVYRGSHPCTKRDDIPNSLDNFFRNTVRSRGIKVLNEHVHYVEDRPSPIVVTENNVYEAALIVLAIGVNGANGPNFLYGYRYPNVVQMLQAEIPRASEWPTSKVIVFFNKPREVSFAAMTPKNNYAVVSVLPRQGRRVKTIKEFLEKDMGRLKQYYPKVPHFLCHCKPLIPVGMAKKYYGRNWVTVGDALTCRLYKDGIGSAYRTARKAMEVAIIHGVSRRSFRKYYVPYCRKIAFDNIIGHILFLFIMIVTRIPLLTRVLARCIELEDKNENGGSVENEHFKQILWALLTGALSYRKIFMRLMSPLSVSIFFRNFYGTFFKGR
ncbi:MAG: hypothetical protein HQK54_04265 [Oligoflexales bacterium]|nr:hypothetical protein [Oligoflexales bacterium]